MEIIYRAFDGKEFKNEDECLSYEHQQEIKALNLQSRFFNFDGEVMDINDLYHCIENGWYMDIVSIEEARIIAEYAEREMSLVLFKDKPTIGRFYYNDGAEEWHNIEELYSVYADKLKIFEG